MSKLTIELGGKYSAGEMFSRAQADVKKFGADTRDLGSGLTRVFDTAVSKIGDVAPAAVAASNAIKGLASGGLWGLLGAAASSAIGFVASKFQEAQEAAKRFNEYVAASMSAAAQTAISEFNKVSQAISQTSRQSEDAFKVLQGKRAQELSNKIYEIHTAALQSVTDDMTAKAKAVVSAQEKLEIASARQAAIAQSQADFQMLHQERIKAADERLAAANEAEAAVKEQVARLTAVNAEQLARLADIDQRLATLKKGYENGVITENTYRGIAAKLLKEENELREDNKATLGAYNDTLAASAKAQSEIAAAQEAIRSENVNLTLGLQQYAAKVNEAQLAVDQASAAHRMAAEAAQAEAQALAASQASIAEKTEIAAEIERQRQEWFDKISKQTRATEEEKLALQEVVNQALQDGIEDMELESELNAKWRELMEKRNAKAEEELKGNIKPTTTAAASVAVTIDKSTLNDAAEQNAEKTEKVIPFRKEMHELRDRQREVRDRKTSIRTSQPDMMKYLKGQMQQKERENWERYIAKNLSRQEALELANYARKGELMSADSKEWMRQNKRVNQLLDAAFGADKVNKRDEDAKKTADNTKKIADKIEKIGVR